MNPTKCFEDKKTSILLEFVDTTTQKEIILQHLKRDKGLNVNVLSCPL